MINTIKHFSPGLSHVGINQLSIVFHRTLIELGITMDDPFHLNCEDYLIKISSENQLMTTEYIETVALAYYAGLKDGLKKH